MCRGRLELSPAERRWVCAAGHSFDVAREGYVNLLVSGQRKNHRPGDSAEMVAARRRFLASGAYDPMTDVLAAAVAAERPATVLDAGCGEGRHTRGVHGGRPRTSGGTDPEQTVDRGAGEPGRSGAPCVLGVDVAKPAVAAAARADPAGWYAVASAAELPLDDAAVDVALVVFGPVMPAELARVVRPGGAVVAAHPGPGHLADLRRLVYADPRPHELKPPLRHETDRWSEAGSLAVEFPVVVDDPDRLADLFAMTPYRWHAPADIRQRLEAAASATFETAADVRITTYRRRAEG